MTKDQLRSEAAQLGFGLCRIARAGFAPHSGALHEWLQNGNHGSMDWMRRTELDRANPERLLPGARSIIVLATNYYSEEQPLAAESGRVARYARGSDYHNVLTPRLNNLAALLTACGGTQKCFIDGGPVLERDWAAECGVSWHGKSTMGINPQLGTWFFLSVILTTLELEPDTRLADRCGRCTRCLDSCPTKAITAPYVLDARRCISYLTIENKGPIPEEFREAVGDRIFGCDDCLEACPWNRFAQASHDAQFTPDRKFQVTPLREFLALDDTQFKTLFRNSPILRAKRRGFLRNVCVALGNKGTAEDLPALHLATNDAEPLIREHARWAIKRISERESASRHHQPRCSTESR